MTQYVLLNDFLQFGLAALIGFLIGLEREMGVSSTENVHAGIRDFIMFALLGAISAYAAEAFDNSWLILAGFTGFLAMLVSGYWADRPESGPDNIGITTELAGILTFFMGVLIMRGSAALTVGLSIGVIAILSQKKAIYRFRSGIKRFELEAALKFLIITFIVLPILPNKSLDSFLTIPIGTVTEVRPEARELDLELIPGYELTAGERVSLYSSQGDAMGHVEVARVLKEVASLRFGDEDSPIPTVGQSLKSQLRIGMLTTMLSAINPYKVWLIVVLVSFISFVGYVLIKIMGGNAGIGLTGLIGGLASSTVTTLSFAKRSREAPAWNRSFAVAVILASAVMFPRLLVQISFVNIQLVKNMALPILVMGATGLILAAGFYYISSKHSASGAEELSFDNPFSLKSAVTFGLVFSAILMITRLAITYLGDAWLPLVSIVSGLTDADAIAFSISDAQQAGMISLDWASFNLVLGALSNTFMKLFLVLTLGDRGLFKHLLVAFLIMGASGIIAMALYYDFSSF